MKTIETENNEQKFVPGLQRRRDKFRRQGQQKLLFIAALLLLFVQLSYQFRHQQELLHLIAFSENHPVQIRIEKAECKTMKFLPKLSIHLIKK